MRILETVRQLDRDMAEIATLHTLVDRYGAGALIAAEQSSDRNRLRAAKHLRELCAFDAANGPC